MQESDDVEFSNAGNTINGLEFGCTIKTAVFFFIAIEIFSWCAPSGFGVCLPEPAPKDLKGRKAPSKIKIKETPKMRNASFTQINIKPKNQGWSCYNQIFVWVTCK